MHPREDELTHSSSPAAGLTEQIVEYMRDAYGIHARHVALVPGRLHADAAAYRVDSDGESYFLKLTPEPPERGLTLAHYVADAGITAVPAPLPMREGQLAGRVGTLSATLYPFVEGENGFQRPLTEGQWRALGGAVRAVHAVELPSAIREGVRTETYSDVFRRKVRDYLALTRQQLKGDAVAGDLMALLSDRHDEITALVDHAVGLAESLQRRALPLVPCHGDLHAGNVLVGNTSAVFIVDWDAPVLAPRERDLMFIGAGIGGVWNRPDEAAAFYGGYGAMSVDAEAVAYYRCERIVEDVTVFCDQILGGAQDDGIVRAILLEKLAAAFAPNDVVEMAERTVAAL